MKVNLEVLARVLEVSPPEGREIQWGDLEYAYDGYVITEPGWRWRLQPMYVSEIPPVLQRKYEDVLRGSEAPAQEAEPEPVEEVEETPPEEAESEPESEAVKKPRLKRSRKK